MLTTTPRDMIHITRTDVMTLLYDQRTVDPAKSCLVQRQQQLGPRLAAEQMKPWGKGEFWGVGSEYDPDWLLTEAQKKLRGKLMELCRTTIRPHAIECDRSYEFPRKNIEALADLGLLGLIIPEGMGGLGQTHACAAMVLETLARYGCPSTAMIFTMHIGACSTLLYRYHHNPHLRELLHRIAHEKLLGACSASDPATGSHDWFPLTSKVRYLDDKTVQLLKYSSWTTSAGLADFYVMMTNSPKHDGNYANICFFLAYQDEVRASTDDWSALGMHGNQSGPMVVEGKFGTERLIGRLDDGRKIMEECIDVWFLLLTSSVWNGISLGCLDLGRKHVTRNAHGDVGMRVCDYPVIQDYFGESLIDTNSCRSMVLLLAQTLDTATTNNDWTVHSDHSLIPRTTYIPWLWQLKFTAAKNVGVVSERTLWACGGSGYKTDLGLERLYRDAKAGWVMAPSNELLRNLVGLSALTGFSSIDLWEEKMNEQVIAREMKKMTTAQKEALGKRLLEEAAQERSPALAASQQHADFDNPFNTCPPRSAPEVCGGEDWGQRGVALTKDGWTTLALTLKEDLGVNMGCFTFALPNPSHHTGCLPGQYLAVRVDIKGKQQLRYFSPVSRPDQYGSLQLVLKYETQGLISNTFKQLQPGDTLEFQGPCGGYEYVRGRLDQLTVLASGAGVTPGLQLLRALAADPSDPTHFTLLYYADTLDHILYRSELDQYNRRDGRVRVVYSLGEAPHDWEGEEGFIDAHMIDKYVPKPNGSKNQVLVCGGPTMSMSCLFSLKTLGFPSHLTFVYGQFGAEQVKAVYGRHAALSPHRPDLAP